MKRTSTQAFEKAVCLLSVHWLQIQFNKMSEMDISSSLKSVEHEVVVVSSLRNHLSRN